MRGLLNQGQQVTHTQDSAGHPIWVEGFDIRDFFTGTGKLNWFASDFTNREGRTATGVPVNLGQNDTGNFKLLVEFSRDIGRFLTDHAVDDQQDFIRLSQGLDITEFFHEFLIDLQAAGRIDENIVVAVFPRQSKTLGDNLDRRMVRTHIKDRYVDLLT